MDGLWTIEFGSNVGAFGSGVVVLRDGKIEGGDSTYFYIGTYTPLAKENVYPSEFRAELEIKPFLSGAPSVFNTVNRDIKVNIEGTFKDENTAVGVGRPEGVPGMDVGIRLKRRTLS